MAITKDEIVALVTAFHDCSCGGGTAAEQARFFLHPEPRIFVPHGEDVSMQTNYEIHRKLTDERHVAGEQWEITPLSESPERARAVGAVYWEGRVKDAPDGALIKCMVGEDWIVQRLPSGELKIALYINPYHHFLPDSAPIALK
jgi:hypothetical protein